MKVERRRFPLRMIVYRGMIGGRKVFTDWLHLPSIRDEQNRNVVCTCVPFSFLCLSFYFFSLCAYFILFLIRMDNVKASYF